MARHIKPVFFCGLEVNGIEFRIDNCTHYVEVFTGGTEQQSGFYGREVIMIPISREKFLELKERLGVIQSS